MTGYSYGGAGGRRSVDGFFWVTQQALEQQAGEKPAGGKVQADHIIYVPSAPAIVPGTELMSGKQAAGEIFAGKDEAHVGQSPEPERPVFQQASYGGHEGGAAVNGKHPDRGVSL